MKISILVLALFSHILINNFGAKGFQLHSSFFTVVSSVLGYSGGHWPWGQCVDWRKGRDKEDRGGKKWVGEGSQGVVRVIVECSRGPYRH